MGTRSPQLLLFVLSLLLPVRGAPAAQPAGPGLEERLFPQVRDHFRFEAGGNETFPQRYLLSAKFWKKGFGPIFFYTGNEGNIWTFAENSDFIFELAEQQQALVIFAEHLRRNAECLHEDEIPKRCGWGIGCQRSCAVCGWAWRSHSVLQRCNSRFSEVHPRLCPCCPKSLPADQGSVPERRSVLLPLCSPGRFLWLREVRCKQWISTGSESHRGRLCVNICVCKSYDEISSKMATCSKISSKEDLYQLFGFARNAFTMIAMMDYPYKTDFMGHLPANPVKVGCEQILAHTDPIQGLAALVGVFYNSSGSVQCYDVYRLYRPCADPTGCGTGADAEAWDYQVCTEINLTFNSNNVTDMFPEMPFTEAMREQYCWSRWRVRPRAQWLRINFWGGDLKSASNIIFSNGDLDPWAGGGINSSLSPSLTAVTIQGGAHHLDLRGHNPADPPSVIEARKLEASIISNWVKSARMERAREQRGVAPAGALQ